MNLYISIPSPHKRTSHDRIQRSKSSVGKNRFEKHVPLITPASSLITPPRILDEISFSLLLYAVFKVLNHTNRRVAKLLTSETDVNTLP